MFYQNLTSCAFSSGDLPMTMCKSLLIIPFTKIVFTGSVARQPRMLLIFSYFQGDLQDVKFRLGTSLDDCPPPTTVSDHRSISEEVLLLLSCMWMKS